MCFDHECTCNVSDMLQKQVSTCIVSCAYMSCTSSVSMYTYASCRDLCRELCRRRLCRGVAWRDAVPCCAVRCLHHAVPCHLMPYSCRTVPCRSMPMPCHVVPRRTVLVPSRAVPCCAMLCAEVRYHAMPCPPCRAMTCPCRAMTCCCVPYQTV